MKKKNIFKSLIILILAFGILWAGYYLIFSKPDKAGNTVVANTFGWKFPITRFPIVGPNLDQVAYSDIRDPGGIPQGLPVRLQIPVIGVDSAIEDALITPDGRMDVPSGSINVAWFSLGPHPGQIGSAVIGGHFGIKDGVKFVFYDLDKLQVGDKVYILDDKGETLAFQVQSIKLFDRNADATTVFTSNDGLAHLNIITCEGIWNQNNGNYPERRVVFTTAIAGEGAITVKTSSVVTFNRTLRIGARGTDVVALQNALKQIGISLGVADGSFGPLTRGAVAKYQTSAGLSADGVFGPFTKAKLLAELRGDTGLPIAGADKIETLNSLNNSPSSQTFISSLKSLYATPIDGIVTTLLIVAIIFLAFKIIRLIR